MKTILYLDSCIHRENSRTERLAQAYLTRQLAARECQLQTVILEELDLHALSEKELMERHRAAQTGDFSGRLFDLARAFAAADEVVIAAPYWDLSFPAMLKLCIEQLCVNGLTFAYSEKGVPGGLTNIKSVIYLTTAGGYIGQNNFGFDYVKGLFSTLFGIQNITFCSAEGLDIYGNDPESILTEAIKNLPR